MDVRIVDVALICAAVPAALLVPRVTDRVKARAVPVTAWVCALAAALLERAASRLESADRHPRPGAAGRGPRPAPAPTSSFRRLVGAVQPWPHDVDGYVPGCWANKLTDLGMVRCAAPDTNVDGLCPDHANTLQKVRDEDARIDPAAVSA